MTKQTPERFAKNVLWQLAGLRAEVDQLLSGRVIEISSVTGVPREQVRKKMAAEILKSQKMIFAQTLESSEL